MGLYVIAFSARYSPFVLVCHQHKRAISRRKRYNRTRELFLTLLYIILAKVTGYNTGVKRVSVPSEMYWFEILTFKQRILENMLNFYGKKLFCIVVMDKKQYYIHDMLS